MRWLLALILLQTGEDLHEAARQSDLARARALIEQGVAVDAGNRYGATALFFAAEKGDLDMVTLLVEHGARLDIEDSFYKMSALSRALSGEHFDVARFLLSRGSPGADAVIRVGVAKQSHALVEAALETGDVTRPAFDRALETAAGGVRALLEAAEVPAGAPAEPVELSREELERFVGAYENETERRFLTVALQGGTLEVSGDLSAPLRATGEQEFEVVGSDAEVFFAGRGGMNREPLPSPGRDVHDLSPARRIRGARRGGPYRHSGRRRLERRRPCRTRSGRSVAGFPRAKTDPVSRTGRACQSSGMRRQGITSVSKRSFRASACRAPSFGASAFLF